MNHVRRKQICETPRRGSRAGRRCRARGGHPEYYVRPAGKLARAGNDVSALMTVLPRCRSFIEAARALGVRVVHVRIATLPGGQSDSPASIRGKEVVSGSRDFALEGMVGAEICDECAPLPTEAVITKHRSSGFQGTDLDLVLRFAALPVPIPRASGCPVRAVAWIDR
jgi:hypothetical protein